MDILKLYEDIGISDLKPVDGVIDYRGLPDRVIEEPDCDSDFLRRNFYPVAERLNKYLAETEGKVLAYGNELKIRWMEPVYRLSVDKGRLVVEKILGFFNPRNYEIGISRDLPAKAVSCVLGHELYHYAQEKTGDINRYIKKYGEKARDYIEKAADYVTGRLFGKGYKAFAGI